MINGEPVKAFEYQDQEAHIRVHMSAIQDPELAQMGANNPQGYAVTTSIFRVSC